MTFGRGRHRARSHLHQPPRGEWLPTRLGSLRLWLRADLGVATSGADVTAWANQYTGAGAWGNLSQASGTLRPTLQSSAINGRPAVRTDGSNDVLSGTTTHNAATMHLFMVCQPRVIQNNFTQKGVFALTRAGQNDFNSTQIGCVFLNDGGTCNGRWFYNSLATANATTLSTSTAYLVELSINGSTAALTFGDTQSIVSTGTLQPTGYQLGARWVGAVSSPYASVDFAEIVVSETVLSASDRTNLRAYFARRYGVS